jgi:hypothetical protein
MGWFLSGTLIGMPHFDPNLLFSSVGLGSLGAVSGAVLIPLFTCLESSAP